MSRKSTPERDALIAGLLEKMRRQLQEQLPDEQATLDQIEEAAGKIARQISQDVQRRLVAQRATKQPQPPATKCTCGAPVGRRCATKVSAGAQHRDGSWRADLQARLLPLCCLSAHAGPVRPGLRSG